jgi:phosphoserine phosphatase RsbU/P
MHSRLLHARLWLEHHGLFPRGKLASLTLYVLALDVLLFVIEKVVGIFRSSYGASLSGWVVSLTLLGIGLLGVLTARRISSKLLWRLRNRLVVTYILVGVLPLVLLAALGGLAFYLFSGQFATYIVTSKLELHLRALRANDLVIAYKTASDIDRGQQSDFGRREVNKPGELRELQITEWLDGKLLFADPASGERVPTPSLPNYLPADFNQVVRDGGRLFLRSAITLQTQRGKLTVISSKPLDRSLLRELAMNLGEVGLYASGLTIHQLDENASAPPGVNRSAEKFGQEGTKYVLDTGGRSPTPTYVVGTIPPPTRIFDRPVSFITSIAVVNWIDGGTSQPAAISVQTRLSALYDQLFAALGDFAPAIEIVLLVATIAFAIIVAIALFMGSRLSRSITGAVAELYLATTHVNRGDFSHRIPVTSNDQLAALANSFNSMTESIQNLIVEQKQKQRLENEIAIAQEVQAQLFPRHITQLPSLEVHGFCRPARSVSGDYYDFLSIGPERLLLAVGDVSGKGISAALLMATIHSAVRAYSVEGVPALRQVQAVGGGPGFSRGESVIEGAEICPATLLSLLNHQLYHSTPQEKYATLFLAMYDADDRRLTFSNAGHLPPLVLSETGIVKRLEDGGTVVGLFDHIKYDEDSVQLRPGEIFLAYSDGVTEPENDFGEFGEQRLIELVQENRDLPLARITEIVTAAVDDWIGAAEQPDDVTLVLARAR